jgi:hypothetical protein
VRKMKSISIVAIDDKGFWKEGEVIEMISGILCFRLRESDHK